MDLRYLEKVFTPLFCSLVASEDLILNLHHTKDLKKETYCNIAQLLLFSYFKIRFYNCVSLLLSTHYSTCIFTGPFDLAKAQNQAQKSIWTPVINLP